MTPDLAETVKRLRELAVRALEVDALFFDRLAKARRLRQKVAPQAVPGVAHFIQACDPTTIVAILAELERVTRERDADRERLAQWMIQHSYATGHGDDIADLLGELTAQHEAKVATLERGRDEAKAGARTPGTVEVCERSGCQRGERSWADCTHPECPANG